MSNNLKNLEDWPSGSPQQHFMNLPSLGPKSNKALPSIGLVHNDSNNKNTIKQSVISINRENSIKRDNWNLLVGDARYKTNFFLRFNDAGVRIIYEKSLLPTAYYSIRLFIIMICLVDIFMLDTTVVHHTFLSRVFVVSMTVLSLYATTKPGRLHSL